ncbi:SRPBCC family protein [Kribbella pratensis]|jgi:uncharacterized protein YndB with AHSA1/START domain|uniref:Polyketide cyclase/dehydrase/lipid transport protein n=1 Tax=Kribbella pratensis TaxID=2512112 RepID=A0A4R8CJE3_9ACTN|nr:SRPBCC family protein [Kribbella pratensis]TDW76589.1 hypothetical protein EV653_1746 [Kribbella pratensis]
MSDHEAWTTIDVAPNIVFDRLSDLDRLPGYLPWLTELHPMSPRPVEAQGPEVRLPHQAVHREVDLTAGDSHEEGWVDVLDEDRILRWGTETQSDYHGELVVDFVADGTSKLTVRLRTSHDDGVDAKLGQALTELKAALEQESRHPESEPEA